MRLFLVARSSPISPSVHRPFSIGALLPQWASFLPQCISFSSSVHRLSLSALFVYISLHPFSLSTPPSLPQYPVLPPSVHLLFPLSPSPFLPHCIFISPSVHLLSLSFHCPFSLRCTFFLPQFIALSPSVHLLSPYANETFYLSPQPFFPQCTSLLPQ